MIISLFRQLISSPYAAKLHTLSTPIFIFSLAELVQTCCRATVRNFRQSFKEQLRPNGSWKDFCLRRVSVRKWQAHGGQSIIGIRMKKWTTALLFLAGTCFAGSGRQAEGQLRWPDPPKKAPMRVRLVAVALADHPRSSFFPSHEVFVAETEIGNEEWSLIKLDFTFLPYQPRLSESGFDYSVVHELAALRDPNCDETVSQLTWRSDPDRHEPLVYSRNVPREDLDRRRIPLPCYETNADDYIKASFEPIAPPPKPPEPVLKERPKE